MPVIARCFGISIAILYRDHDPPHFHAYHGDHVITVGIRDGAVADRVPPRALGLVAEWLALHREDRLSNWDRARLTRHPRP